MAGCILTDPDAVAKRDRMVAAAEMVGSKVLPMISEFCEFHHQHHAVRMSGAAVSDGYQSVQLTQDEEKADGRYQPKERCSICSSYHMAGQCRGSRTRESVGS